MPIVMNSTYAKKAVKLKRPLVHRDARPKQCVEIIEDSSSFQGLRAVPAGECGLPITFNSGDRVILDFGDHCVGQLNFAISHLPGERIADSPVMLKFSFGEFPLEVTVPAEEYKGTLGRGWLQNETRSVVFTPYRGVLERRYAFRYLKIERVDSAVFPIAVTDIYADTVSSVVMDEALLPETGDPVMDAICRMSLKTLKECEQDVFEDGPKRDRRLWIGDLRLQAMVDYLTFQNRDLVKRCIYLFAAYRTDSGLVSPCVFPDSAPCIDNWVFIDYSLLFISCLLDYTKNCGDMELLEELYPVAAEQAIKALDKFDYNTGELTGAPAHIEWCAGLDKGLAAACVLIYTMKQLIELTELLEKDTTDIRNALKKVTDCVLVNHEVQRGLYKTYAGQISWASQIWLVLADILPLEENIAILNALELEQPDYGIHTPYLMHYYIDAMYQCGLKEKAMGKVRDFWGQLVDFGFDCCPEIFNPADHFESPYKAAELNSACHAWSCTPIYWIKKYLDDKGAH